MCAADAADGGADWEEAADDDDSAAPALGQTSTLFYGVRGAQVCASTCCTSMRLSVMLSVSAVFASSSWRLVNRAVHVWRSIAEPSVVCLSTAGISLHASAGMQPRC
jgi:hypothetical protein